MEKTANVYRVILDERYDKNIKEQARINSLTQEEKGYSSKLNHMGRIAFFKEYFEGKKLEEQQIPSIGPFDNPKKMTSFQNGYQRAALLVNNGFSYEDYKKYIGELEEKTSSVTSKRSR